MNGGGCRPVVPAGRYFAVALMAVEMLSPIDQLSARRVFPISARIAAARMMLDRHLLVVVELQNAVPRQERAASKRHAAGI